MRKWTPNPPEKGPSGRKAVEGKDYTRQDAYMVPLRKLPTGGFYDREDDYKKKKGNILIKPISYYRRK